MIAYMECLERTCTLHALNLGLSWALNYPKPCVHLHPEPLLFPAPKPQINRAKHNGSLKKPLKVKFIGEEGVDEGGVQKEFFQLLVSTSRGRWLV